MARSIDEIRRTPVLALTEDEVAMLDPSAQAFARRAREQRARENACPGHERVGTGTHMQARRGWHPGTCRHCGMDMSVDSGG
jgi:hypothetical protein